MNPADLNNGLFDTLALPRPMELYRRMVIHQVHSKCPTIMFNTMCWASTEVGNADVNQSQVVVLPGEEEYMLKVHGITFEPMWPQAIKCPHRRVVEKVPDRQIQAAAAAPEGSAVKLPVRTMHECTASPQERPILCRLFPFGIRRDPKNPRRAVIVCEVQGWNYMQRRMGSNAITQMCHNIANVFVPMWDFLTEQWWDYYNTAYNPTYDWVQVTDFKFSINSDIVHSMINGAPDTMKAELLAEIANPKCPACEGKGIEFWDTVVHPVFKTRVPIPPDQRRFDLCRTCVLPQLGMLHRGSGLLINPGSGKILTPDGKGLRGDKA